MELETKVLDTLFRRISPSRILSRVQSENIPVGCSEDYQLFRKYCGTSLGEYSLDEQSLIFSRLESEAAGLADRVKQGFGGMTRLCPSEQELSLPAVSLYTVLRQANVFLTRQGEEPQCRIEQVLPWREAFLILGQDLFVCAFLAQEDLRVKHRRRDFTWPAVLRTNHVGLNTMLQQGLAENHQHLYGSSQTMALSWCSLMNYPESHRLLDVDFAELFQSFEMVSSESGLTTTKERVGYACSYRSMLFKWLKGQENNREGAEITAQKCQLDWLYVERTAAALRAQYGAQIPQPNGGTACLDYALEEYIFQAAPDAHYRSLAGERKFLYDCFRAFLCGEMDNRTQYVFYLYIILKSLFRAELIQVNKKVGFRNFSDYQDRKTLLCEQSFYQAELIRMALNAPLTDGNVTSLETRITPKPTVKRYITSVQENDRLKAYADITFDRTRSAIPITPQENTGLAETHIPYFYVIHFIKQPDDDLKRLERLSKHPETIPSSLMLVSRHQRLRRTIRNQAIALAKTLSNEPNMRRRVRGIDCASHEVGCPPEVFASVFRFLRNYAPSDYAKGWSSANVAASYLCATYHAGEDFLDIAGALRSIDEAVTFLELGRGDRIGHGLGLGIDPEVHYSLKGRRVYLRKQDRLDDLVWLLYRSRELGLHIPSHTYGILKREAELLLREIYGEAMDRNGWNISLTDYHCSMYLRADDPELYIHTDYRPPNTFLSPFEKFKRSTCMCKLDEYRRTPHLAGLYYYYHYGNREKIIGNQIEEVVIDDDYIALLRQAQDVQQKYLAEIGIAIECNPSSNVLIGTFGHYARHPIFRFNNTDLERDVEKYKTCPQLQVCVNTDDLGVFDTSQEFEYALLFRALSDMRDVGGVPLYKEPDILRYLNNLRQMGHDVSFDRTRYYEHAPNNRIIKEDAYGRYCQRI